jgi:hypothetical protein
MALRKAPGASLFPPPRAFWATSPTVPNGQTAHHNLPKRKKDRGSSGHQRLHTVKVAGFLDARGEPIKAHSISNRKRRSTRYCIRPGNPLARSSPSRVGPRRRFRWEGPLLSSLGRSLVFAVEIFMEHPSSAAGSGLFPLKPRLCRAVGDEAWLRFREITSRELPPSWLDRPSGFLPFLFVQGIMEESYLALQGIYPFGDVEVV